jgi:hypothetical protein
MLDDLQKELWQLHHLRNDLAAKQAKLVEVTTILENTQEWKDVTAARHEAETAKFAIANREAAVRQRAIEMYRDTGITDFGGAYIKTSNVGVIKDAAKALHWAVAKTLYGLLKIDNKAFELVAKRMVAVDPDLAECYEIKEEVTASIKNELKEHLQ